MNQQVQAWLAQHAATEGVLACGIRLADQSVQTEVRAPGFSVDGLETAWRCATDTYQVLKHHRLPGVNLRWVFETSILYCLASPDGACLMVFTSSKPEDVDGAGLQKMFSEFLGLE